MNQNKDNVQYYEGEIYLRELIMALWKRKKMIVAITMTVAILAGIFSKFVLSPVYDTKLDIVISVPEICNTRYGEYKLPITTNGQFIDLITSNDVIIYTIKEMKYNTEDVTLEELKKRIHIEQIDERLGTLQNSFEVTVSADNPEESLNLAKTLFESYTEFMDVMIKERAVGFYYNDFSVKIQALEDSLDSTKEILKKNEELLTQTPQIIAKGEANLEIQTQLNDTTDYVVPVNTVNPNYIQIENNIVENKQTINSIENSIRMNNQFLEELDKEKKSIAKYYETGKSDPLESSVIGIIETSVYLPSTPVAPSQKTSPNNTMNVAIGAIVGGMIGFMAAFVMEYWFKKE